MDEDYTNRNSHHQDNKYRIVPSRIFALSAVIQSASFVHNMTTLKICRPFSMSVKKREINIIAVLYIKRSALESLMIKQKSVLQNKENYLNYSQITVKSHLMPFFLYHLRNKFSGKTLFYQIQIFGQYF